MPYLRLPTFGGLPYKGAKDFLYGLINLADLPLDLVQSLVKLRPMAYVCEVCSREFGTPGSLGSHMRVHKEPRVKANSGEVTVRILVEQAPSESRQDVQPEPYRCPDCGGSLELMHDSPGLYKLRCAVCCQ